MTHVIKLPGVKLEAICKILIAHGFGFTIDKDGLSVQAEGVSGDEIDEWLRNKLAERQRTKKRGRKK